GPVALALGVRGLADDGHRDVVRAVHAGAVAAVPDGGAGVPDALEDGGAGGDVPGGALPGDGPAAALVADVVGVRARDAGPGARPERQHVPVVLQQDLRGGHGLAGQRPVRGAAYGGRVRAVRERLLEQAPLDLLGEDAADRVVDPRLRHPAGLDLGAQQVDEA